MSFGAGAGFTLRRPREERDIFESTEAFSGFAVDDLEKAQDFCGGTRGLKTSVQDDVLFLHIAGDRDTLVYPKPDYTPATYTMLNLPVRNAVNAA
jgi:hypothetical protein